MMPARIKNDDLKRDFSVIEQKRRVLEQVVVITRAIENLQQSLNAVLVLGVASKALPEDRWIVTFSLLGAASGALFFWRARRFALYCSDAPSM